MKALKKLLALTFAIMMVTCLFSLNSSAAGTAVNRPAIVSSAGSLNVRQQPNSDTIVGHISLGDEVLVYDQVTDSSGNIWYHLKYITAMNESVDGYAMAKYMTLMLDVAMVTAGEINVRSDASTSATRIGGLSYGKPVCIYEKISNSEGTWYKTTYSGSVAYVKSDYVGIMSEPQSPANASYKKDVTADVIIRNIPGGYKATVNSQTFTSDGSAAQLKCPVHLGQLTDDVTLPLKIYNADGVLMRDTSVIIKVDNGFMAKISAFFGFVFSGFKWGSETVTVS